MEALAFDTLKYAQRMKAVGFTEEQASEQANALGELVNDKLATKKDLKELELHLTAATKRDLKELELRLTVRLGGMMCAAVVIVATLVKIL
jgi:hypothetical protein